jgi:hypothetical protein
MFNKFFSFLLLPAVIILLIAETIWQTILFFVKTLKQNTHEAYLEYKHIWYQKEDYSADDDFNDVDDDFWNAK